MNVYYYIAGAWFLFLCLILFISSFFYDTQDKETVINTQSEEKKALLNKNNNLASRVKQKSAEKQLETGVRRLDVDVFKNETDEQRRERFQKVRNGEFKI